MSLTSDYLGLVYAQLTDINENEQENIESAAELMKETLVNDGIIYVFGCGHSQMFSMEMFYRTGGLVPVNPMLQPAVSMASGSITSEYERLEGIGKKVFEKSGMTSKDTLIIVSHSGRNPMPIDLAMSAKEAGVSVVTIASGAFMDGVTSRHSSGKFVKDFADVVINNHCVYGDAVVEVEGMDSKIAGTSSILSIFILGTLVVNVVDKCVKEDFYPPIWISGNVDGGDEKNKINYLKYRDRIPYL